jgi:hypothetical protein
MDGTLAKWERVWAPWVRELPWWIVAALVGGLLGALLFPMPAGAQGTYILQWREPVLVTWEAGCPRPVEAELVPELDTGWSRIRADLATMGVEPGPLGDLPFRPYTLQFQVAPGCPGQQPACSTRPDYREARFACLDPRGERSVDHEQEHRKALQLRPLLVRLHGAARAAYIVEYSGHHVGNDRARPVLGVLGNERPIRPVVRPPQPDPEPAPEPVVVPKLALTGPQAKALSRFPPRRWVTPFEADTTAVMCKRLVRKGALETDGMGRYRRATR